MKKALTFLILVLVVANIWSQVPQKMSYQAVIRNSNDQLIANKKVGMQISILKGEATGAIIYSETQTPTTNSNGLVSIEIGTGTTSDDFSGIDWVTGIYFIKTETDPTGGVNYTITGTSQLLSVPYALHAKTADEFTGEITFSETDPNYTISQAANITSNDINNLSNLSGTNTGDQDLSGLATSATLTTGLNSKVDKVTGKGLSSNDYTTVEQTKVSNLSGTNTGDQDLSGLATTATLTTGLNSKVDKVTGKGLSTIDYTTAEQTKVSNLSGTNTGDQDLSGFATTATLTTGLESKVDKVIGKGLSTNDYTTIEQTKVSNLSGTNTGDQDLSGFATHNALIDTAIQIRNSIPVNVSQLNNNSGYLTSYEVTENDVKAHELALSINENQISDLQNYLLSEVDGSISNEIQTISRVGLIVTLNNGGGTFSDSVNTQDLSNVLTVNNSAGNKQIKNLARPTAPNDAATKEYVDSLKNRIYELETKAGLIKITDIDGNNYRIVEIGDQTWMAENLRVTHYPNGNSIPKKTDNTIWSNMGDNGVDDAYCWYNNDSLTYSIKYGALYTWAAAMGDNAISSSLNPSGIQGACPDNWHLPSQSEWEVLKTFIQKEGFIGYEAFILRSTFFWEAPGNGNDYYSFSFLPSGIRDQYDNGQFGSSGSEGFYWTSTEHSSRTYNAYDASIQSDLNLIHEENKSHGLSIRCVKD